MTTDYKLQTTNYKASHVSARVNIVVDCASARLPVAVRRTCLRAWLEAGSWKRGTYRERVARILSFAPGAMLLLDRRFQLLILATVVSNNCAIEKRVSPRLTL
jgi:hypothetical protein